MIDPSVNMPPLRPVLHDFARRLGSYGLMLSSWTDYHMGPGHDEDWTDLAVAFPSNSKLLKSSHQMAKLDTTYRRPHLYKTFGFDGRVIHKDMKLAGYLRLLTGWGDELSQFGLPVSRLGEQLSLARIWDSRTKTQVSASQVIDVMRLPLDVYDRRQVLAHASDLLPEMMRYRDMHEDYLIELFQLEQVREQDITYRMMKKHGLIGKVS